MADAVALPAEHAGPAIRAGGRYVANWVKARGMGWYLIVFQGGNALGSAVLGIGAQQAG